MAMAPVRNGNRLFVLAVALVAALVAAQVAFVPTAPSGRAAGLPKADSAARDVDGEQIRRLIIEGRLSDREAEHYRKLDKDRREGGGNE